MASLSGVTHMTDFIPRVLEFSTKGVPEKDKAAFWREHYGQVMLRVDLEPAPDRAFEAAHRCLHLPSLQLMEGSSSPAKISRSGQYLDGNDDILLAINRSGSVIINSGGRECTLGRGEAIVLSAGEAGSYHRTSAGGALAVRVPRTMFDSTVVSIDDALMRRIPADHGALKLMEDYASWVLNAGSIDHQLLNLSVRHIQDLLALTIGPAADFADTARTRGLRASRLKLAKSYIVSQSPRRDLSVGAVASSLNVTPRYVQRLFEADGTTFSEFLTRQRLARAHRLLCEPSSGTSAISTIAYDVGFGDLSYFNRCFRREYGMTPREVRGDRA
jgi:AraC-like DNA-binding protein